MLSSPLLNHNEIQCYTVIYTQLYAKFGYIFIAIFLPPSDPDPPPVETTETETSAKKRRTLGSFFKAIEQTSQSLSNNMKA